MVNCFYITKQEIREEREFIEGFLRDVQKKLRKEWKFSFSHEMVGSARRKLVVKKGNSPWDLDYQLKITSNKAKVIKKSVVLFEIKNKIKEWIEEHANDSRIEGFRYTAKLSTSVVTLTKIDENNNKNMHYDFAILNWNNEILKHKISNSVQWNEITDFPKAIVRYNEIKGKDMWKDFREIYKNKKCNNTNKIPGYSIFAISIKETLEKYKKW